MRDVILSFIDVETGGFDETKHGLLEVAIVKTTARGELLEATEIPIRLLAGRVVTAEAFCLHGLDGSDGLDPAQAYRAMKASLDRTMVAGYNVSFDLRFLRQLAIDVGGPEIEWADHHQLDLAPLVIPAWLCGDLDSCSLAKAAAFFGSKVHAPAHRAISDCMTTVELYRAILNRRAMAEQAIETMEGDGYGWTGTHWTP